jgi:hypothetical protein
MCEEEDTCHMLSMDRQYLKAGSLAEEEDTCVRRRIHVICYPWTDST